MPAKTDTTPERDIQTVTTPEAIWIIEKKNGKFETVYSDPAHIKKFNKDWIRITKYVRVEEC